MAKVTTTKADVRFLLEIDVAEAQYLYAALSCAEPTHLCCDEVFDELVAALCSVGIEPDAKAAKVSKVSK